MLCEHKKAAVTQFPPPPRPKKSPAAYPESFSSLKGKKQTHFQIKLTAVKLHFYLHVAFEYCQWHNENDKPDLHGGEEKTFFSVEKNECILLHIC